jgi:hypothetical protein
MNHELIKELHRYADKHRKHFVHFDAGRAIGNHIEDMLDTFEPGALSYDAERSHIEKIGYLYQLLEGAYQRGVIHGKDKACLALTKVIRSE